MIVENLVVSIFINVGVLVRVEGGSRHKMRVRSSWIEMRFFRVKEKKTSAGVYVVLELEND
jgi:hypothetical protein